MKKIELRLLVIPILAGAAVSLCAQAPQKLSPAPDFMPEWTFSGSALTGYQQSGGATWKAENGEITGTPASGGGWLMLDKPFQDVQFFTNLKCDGACDAGVLLRAEKTPEGTQGILVSLKQGDVHNYKVTIDASGKIIKREQLTKTAWGFIRTATAAPAPGPNGPLPPTGGAGGNNPAGPGEFRQGVALPTVLPELEPTAIGFAKQPGGWDKVQIIYDSNIVRPFLNYTNEIAPNDTGDTDGYGPIALYVGGSGAVHFKDVSWKDLALRPAHAEIISSNFRKQQIEMFDYAWGSAVGDINHDGIPDVVAGAFYYLGPKYDARHEIYLTDTVSPGRGFPRDMVTHVFDFNGDGWDDVLATESRAMVLYLNPKGENRRWKRYPAVSQVTSEVTAFRDLDGDGKPELIYLDHGAIAYSKFDPANPTAPWTVHRVSNDKFNYVHGIGAGDVNGDGRVDIVGPAGWWEQPVGGGPDDAWKYHAVAFARWGRTERLGGAEMHVMDVNGDGLPDVVTSLHAHYWGLAWFEQKRSKSGEITFERHMIMDNFTTKNAGGVTFSEMHGMAIGDIDGDGIPDIITGKRFWSHLDDYWDPDSEGDPVLYVFKTRRNPKAPGGAEFVPELVHNRSGVGSQVTVADLNKDKALDIITSTDMGIFIFWGKPKGK